MANFLRPVLISLILIVLASDRMQLQAKPEAPPKIETLFPATIQDNGTTYILQTPEEIRAGGIPYPDVPKEKNAAFVYLQAFKLIKQRGNLPQQDLVDQQWSHTSIYGWKEKLPALENWVNSNLPAFEIVKKITDFKQCRFPVYRTRDKKEWHFPHIIDMLRIATVVSLRVSHLASNEKYDEVLQWIKRMFRISRHLSQEPYPTSYHVSQDWFVRALEALGEISHYHKLGKKQLQAAARLLEEVGDYRPTNKKNEESPEFRAIAKRLEDIALLKGHELIKLEKEFPAHYFKGLSAELRSIVIAFPSAQRGFLEVDCHFQLLRTAIALQRYNLDRGRFPDSLKQLVPDYMKTVPVDTFNPADKPFVYKPAKTGYLLYSYWINAKADEHIEKDGYLYFCEDRGYRFPPPTYRAFKLEEDPVAPKLDKVLQKELKEACELLQREWKDKQKAGKPMDRNRFIDLYQTVFEELKEKGELTQEELKQMEEFLRGVKGGAGADEKPQ